MRALTEAVQVRITYIIGSREDLLPYDYTQPAITVKLRNARSLMDTQGPRCDFRKVPTQYFEIFEDEVRWMLGKLQSAGAAQVVFVDLTQPELQLPVVRVVIPGLEGSDHHDSYVPGARARAAREGQV